MRSSLFPSDDSLPTWLHTALLVAIVSPFFLIPLWWGLGAIVSGCLEPLPGPDFGQFFLGRTPLHGGNVRLAGLSLVFLAGAFAAVAVQYSRFASESRIARTLPWVLVALFAFCSLFVNAHA